MSKTHHPIENIEWRHVDDLSPNDYNPNVVMNDELTLLKHNILTLGWAQPVLARKGKNEEGTHNIIDGFHRWHLTGHDKELREFTGGKVPVCFLEITDAEAIALTVRINRAKGVHIACKLHEIVRKLYDEEMMSIEEIGREIGGDAHEVQILLAENVFEKKDTKRHKYSKAWIPQQSSPEQLDPYLEKKA